MAASPRILLVDDDAAVREALAQTLDLHEMDAIVTGSFVAAKGHITRAFDGVILSDIRMPGRDGFHLLDYTRAVDPDLPVVLLTGEGDIPMAVRAMGEGAFDFLEKPCAPADLIAVLTRALEVRSGVMALRAERRQSEEGDAAARLLFGVSDRAETLRAQVRAAGRSDAETLITSPPGGGVSKVAEAIHLCSPRLAGPFVKVSGQGLDREALDAALARAEGGTLFVDQIGALEGDVQMYLLDRLEAGGAPRTIAATQDPLDEVAGSGRFAPDLFYRLAVMRVDIPALADRPEDIPVLFRHYVAQAAEQSGQTAPDVPPGVVAGLMARDWPGNARALMSEAMRFVLGVAEAPAAGTGLGLAEQMAQVERSLLAEALRRAEGQASAAAKALKLPRKTFYDKLARYGLRAEDFR